MDDSRRRLRIGEPKGPIAPSQGAPTSGSALAKRAASEARARVLDFEDERERMLAVLSGVERNGAWEPAGHISILAFWGGAKLDFREADLLEGETVVEVLAIMGGVQILAPRDVHVEAQGLGLMGGFTHLVHRAADADAPLLRVKGFALMGGVDVRVK